MGMHHIRGGSVRVSTAIVGVVLVAMAAVVGWAGAASAADPNTFNVNLEVLGTPPPGATVERLVTCSGGIAEDEVIPLADSTHPVSVAASGLCTADLRQTADTPDSLRFIDCEATGDATCTDDTTVQFAASGSGTVTFTVALARDEDATVSATSLHPGDDVQFSAGGYAPSSAAIIDLYSDAVDDPVRIGIFPVGADGTLRATVVIPADAPLGPAELVSTGDAPDESLLFGVADVDITAAPAVVPVTTPVTTGATTPTTAKARTGTIPKTGAGTRSTGLLAMALLGLGMVALGASFQRRPQSSRV
jgi:hypothetical protein